MAVMKSFELNGNKQSFANWISNLSPCDTPFSSMIGKEGITQSQYSWQVDTLSPADNTTYEEGSDVEFRKPEGTHVATNFTSILRKVVQVSETAEKVSTHGRASELAYQMKKAGKELMRDLELMNLHQVHGNPATSTLAGKFYGFQGMCAEVGDVDQDTGAETHNSISVLNTAAPWFQPSDIFDITYNLYLAGSKADKIMYHPRHAIAFASMINDSYEEPKVYRMFDEMNSVYNTQVKRIKDPLGRYYTLIPNRFMPEDKIFFFTEADWTQMILRAPQASKLSKSGSSERFLVEMEVGLRHRQPYASGILTLIPTTVTVEFTELEPMLTSDINERSPVTIQAKDSGVVIDGADVVWSSSDDSVFTIEGADDTTNPTGVAHAQLVTQGLGTAKLVVTVDGIPLEYTMSVGRPNISITKFPSELDIGDTQEVTVQVHKTYGAVSAGQGVEVELEVTPATDIEVGSLSTETTIDGVATNTLKGLKEGAVQLVAKVGGAYARPVAVSVVKPSHSVALVANPNPYPAGSDVTLRATITKRGAPVEGKTVSWKFISTIPNNVPNSVITGVDGIAEVTFTPIGNSSYEIVADCEGIESSVVDLEAQ